METRSPTAAIARVMSPPAAIPCTPRAMTSSVSPWTAPHKADAVTKVTSEIWSSSLWPWRSPSLPQRGVLAVAATT